MKYLKSVHSLYLVLLTFANLNAYAGEGVPVEPFSNYFETKKVQDGLKEEASPSVASSSSTLMTEAKSEIPLAPQSRGAGGFDDPVEDQVKDITGIKKYSINLMWINMTLDEKQKYLSNAKDEVGLKSQLLNPVLEWAKANPEAEVNLWFDSVHTTPAAVKNTESVLLTGLESKNVQLRDVREIPIVRDNPDVFSDQIFVYIRIDLLKLMIIVNSIESKNYNAAIFADTAVGDLRNNKDRMTKAELFNPSVMKDLEKFGFLLGETKSGRTENQFLQLANNPRMIAAIKHVINVNLFRLETALNQRDKNDWMLERFTAQTLTGSILHDAFTYYYGTGPGRSIKVRPDVVGQGKETDPWIDYLPENHGYLPWGNVINHSSFPGVWTGKFPPYLNAMYPGIYEVLKFPKWEGASEMGTLSPEPPPRKVDVREGRHHVLDLRKLPCRPPASGKIYRVKLWE